MADDKKFYNDLIKGILDKKILTLLNIIHSKYPDKFTDNNVLLEYEFIKTRIQYGCSQETDTIKPEYKRKSKKKKEPATNTKEKNKLSNENRCCARVWNNIYDKNTLEEISDIDARYKVRDFADINVNSFNKQYIIGSRCKRKKRDGEQYCFQHKMHLPHGNYCDVPTQEICFHYLKECNYI